MVQVPQDRFEPVYGPVTSWRFGRSLGIDPIGPVSTCSFNCVYCQLGEIQVLSDQRRIFVPTAQIMESLASFDPWDVDVITLSGSGEPTLALNLAELLTKITDLTQKPIIVLTNSTLLSDPDVRTSLTQANQVAAKVDAVTPDQLHRINRPISTVGLDQIWSGLTRFRAEYQGHLAIQTMILSPWDPAHQSLYIERMHQLQPQEIQLNTPTRPPPLQPHLEARGNHSSERSYPTRTLKPIDSTWLQTFATQIESATQIPVRFREQEKN